MKDARLASTWVPEERQDVGVGTDKTLNRVRSGTADATIRFDELCSLLERMGFEKRVRGTITFFEGPGLRR